MAFARTGLLAAAALLALKAPPVAAAVDPGLAASLRGLAAQDLRVASVAWRLQTAGVAHCARHQMLSGLVVQHASQYDVRYEAAVGEVLHLRALPAVTGVVPGGAGDRAGVKAGDEIVAIDGAPLIDPAAATASLHHDARLFDRIVDGLRAAFDRGPVDLDVLRDGQRLRVRIEGTPGCASDVQMDGTARNASADGQMVTVAQGMLDFARRDDELAFVIGHELAHNILGHRAFLDETKTSRRGLLAGIGQNGARVRETERQADYLGLYLVAWAGYDVHAAPDFWRRMSRADPLAALLSDGTHPGAGNRVRALEQEAEEIDARRRAGLPLDAGAP